MPETRIAGRRKEVVGEVVSNRMQKTIVVEVIRRKAHPLYIRVISKAKKFYAHDEESRPLSRLKRWTLKDIVRKTALVPEVAADVDIVAGQ